MKKAKPGWRDLVRMVPLEKPPTNGHDEPPPAMKQPVTFDAQDGKQRLLITVNTEGNLDPILWFALPAFDNDNGLLQASVICQHASLMLAEELRTRARNRATGGGDPNVRPLDLPHFEDGPDGS
jgi:hypothetical protein